MSTSPICTTGPGDLGAEAELDAFIGLQMQISRFGSNFIDRGFAKQHEGRALELNHDLGGALRQPLSRAQIERHVRPAPVVDEQLHRDERFGAGIRRHIRLGPIALNLLSPSMPSPYWPRTVRVSTSSSVMGESAFRILACSSRTTSASKETGGSIAVSEMSWKM
jgi:hypothetical protein